MSIKDKPMSETADGVVWVRCIKQKDSPGYEGNTMVVEIGDSESVSLVVVDKKDVIREEDIQVWR